MEAFFESLKGKKVLVTGSSRGIGKALVLAYAQNGADVAVHSIKENPVMNDTLSQVAAYGTNVVAVYGDLSDPDIPKKIVDEAAQKLGGLDIIVCNASIQIRRPWLEVTDEEMKLQAEVNYFGTIKLIQAAVPYMLKTGWGRVITVGSTQQAKPHSEMLIYASLKTALINVVQSLALQLAPYGITVNNMAPGTIYTDRNTEVLKDKAYFEKVRNDIPVKEIGVPEDCVGATLMLSSNSGRYITGENIFIDGGKFI